MPAVAEPPDLLVDSSTAVALLVADHADHARVMRSLGPRRLGLAGHAAFETYSVMTRLPFPLRRTSAVVHELLAASFPENRFLSARAATRLLGRLAALRIAGGAVYDALVGAAAAEHRVPLASLDQRACETYRAVGATVEAVD